MNCPDMLAGKRILLVDDEKDILDTLEDLLEGCETVTAKSYEAALQQIESNLPDMAILDIMGVDGYELLKHCANKGITAVMLTARAQTPDDVLRSYKEGAAYFIPKEEMARIETFLVDIVKAKQKGRNTWATWYDRLAIFGRRTFGKDFSPEDDDPFEKLIKY
jgi:CheY-like chemotaxis protein